MSSRRERREAARGLRKVVKIVGVFVGSAVTFAGAATGGALLHMGTPPVRRVLAKQITSAMATTFKGKLVVENVDTFGLHDVGLRVSVFDPQGKRVLFVDGLRARIGLVDLAKSALTGKGDLVIAITEARIDHVEAVIEKDKDGVLTIQRAFELRNPPSASGAPGRGVEVAIPKIEVVHAWVHGGVEPIHVIDADLLRLQGSFALDPKKTAIDVSHVEIDSRGMPNGANPNGTVEWHLAMPSTTGKDLYTALHFAGTIGGTRATAAGTIDGKDVDVTADVPRVEAAALRAMVPGIPIYDAATAHVTAKGTLPHLFTKAHFVIGPGEVDVDGEVTLGDDGAVTVVGQSSDATRVTGTIVAKHIDVRSFSPTAPPSDLNADTRVSLAVKPGGAVDGDFDAHSTAASIDKQVVPAAHIKGRFTQSKVVGTAEVAEVGAPTEVAFDLHPNAGGTAPNVVDFSTNTNIAELSRVPRLGRIASGKVHLQTKGRFILDRSLLDATATADVSQLSKGEIHFEKGNVVGRVEGPVSHLSANTHLTGTGLTYGKYVFSAVDATTKGAVTSPEITASLTGENTPDVHAHAVVHAGGATDIDGVEFSLHRKDVTMVARVAAVHIDGRTVRLDGIVVLGLGQPTTGSLRISPGALAVKAKSQDIDLARVGTLFGYEDTLQEGHVALDADVTSTKRTAEGKVSVDLQGGKFPLANGASGRLVASFDGKHLSTELHASVGDVGWANVVATDVMLAGGLMEASSWQAATGHVAVEGNVDLEKVSSLAPEDSLPFEKLGGRIVLEAKAGRDRAGGRLDVDLTVATKDLVAIGKVPEIVNPDGTEQFVPPPWQTSGLDVELEAHHKGATNHTEVLAQLKDKLGMFVGVSVKGTPPLAEIAGDPSHALARLEGVPIEGRVVLPKRAFDKFPALVKPEAVRGEAELAVDVTGTALAPHAVIRAKAHGLQAADSPNALPLDLDANASYDAEKGTVRVVAMRPEGVVLDAGSTVHFKFADLVRPKGDGDLPWDASAKVTMNRFPLQAIPATADRGVQGHVTGAVTLDDLHKDAKLDGELGVDDLRIGDAKYKRGDVAVSIGGGTVKTSARLEQTDGYADVKTTAGLAWGAAVAPKFDATKPVDVALDAKGFRAGVAQPFVEDMFSELDGRIDADAKIHVDPNDKDSNMVGTIAVHDGVFEIPAIGEEFHGAHAEVHMEPGGTIKIENVGADGVTGHVDASAKVELNGLAFQNAEGSVHVPERRKLPLTLEGVQLGEASAEISATASASADGKTITVDVNVPKLHAELPQSTGHAVQPLEDNPDVRVGVHETDGDFAIIPLAPPTAERAAGAKHLHLAFHLGDDVTIKRDTSLKVALTGTPTVDITDQTHVTGQIALTQGKLELQGKIFTIESGTVSFVGADPGNPEVVARAYWDAPDGTRVYADFVGPVKTGKVTLHSEPSHTQNEILSLILFGSADGTVGASPPPGQGESSAAKAASVGGGVVTQGLNKALSGVSDVEITTRIDTSESQNPRPELAVQVSKDVTVKLAYNLGLPAPGDNPDRTLLILDYRFIRNWSLVTTFGDQGSSIWDMIWKYRY